jgi:SAM-dependent methyltransferase
MKRSSNRSPDKCPGGAPETETVADILHRYLAEVTPFHGLVRSAEWRLLRQTGLLTDPLLDLGCGDGYFGSLLFDQPPMAGIDPEFDQCLKANARKAYRHVLTADAAAMPIPNSHFRTVVANCVLEHIPDIDCALSEIHRIIMPGGSLLFGVPSHRFGDMLFFSACLRKIGCGKMSHAYGEWFHRHSRHFHVDAPAVWLERLARHDFNVISWEYYLDEPALHAFDLAHYLSLPNLIAHKLTGKWIVFPLSLLVPLYERWLLPHVEAQPAKEGPYIFFRVRKENPDQEKTSPR